MHCSYKGNTTIPPTKSFNVTLTTTMKYYFTSIAAANKYTRRSLEVVIICFTNSEGNDIYIIVYRPIWIC